MLCCGETRCEYTHLGFEGVRLTVGKVEYIVVNYDENDPKVTLSLRQADILHSLAHDDELKSQGGCVPDLQDVASAK